MDEYSTVYWAPNLLVLPLPNIFKSLWINIKIAFMKEEFYLITVSYNSQLKIWPKTISFSHFFYSTLISSLALSAIIPSFLCLLFSPLFSPITFLFQSSHLHFNLGIGQEWKRGMLEPFAFSLTLLVIATVTSQEPAASCHFLDGMRKRRDWK